MSELEIHYPDGLIVYKSLPMDVPFLIGRSSKCNVQLEEPGMQRQHLAIYHRKRQFRLEALKNAPHVLLNGKPVRKAKLSDNDKIVIGEYRFVMRIAKQDSFEGTNPFIGISSEMQAAPEDEESTYTLNRGEQSESLDMSDLAQRESSSEPDREEVFEDIDDDSLVAFRDAMSDDEIESPSLGKASVTAAPLLPAPVASGETNAAPSRSAPQTKQRSARSPLDELAVAENRAVAITTPKAARKRQEAYYVPMWKSPLFLGITIGLSVLFLAGGILSFVVNRLSAEKQFDAALHDLDDGLYQKAIRRFDRFLESFPNNELAEKAVVWRGLARARQFADAPTPLWEQSLDACRQLLEEADGLAFLDDHIEEVAGMLTRTAQGLATQARDESNQQMLDQSLDALELLDRSIPVAHHSVLEIEKIREIIGQGRYNISKSQVREQTLAAMVSAIGAKDPMRVYSEHRRLYRRYADLREDAECLALREQARHMQRDAVTYVKADDDQQPAALPARADRPFRTVVWRHSESADRSNRVVVVPVADALYGLDTGTGEVVWRQSIGFGPAFAPTPLPGDPTKMLIHRPNEQAVALIETKTGRDIWRCSLEPFRPRWQGKPLVHRGNIYLTAESEAQTDSGRLMQLQLSSGRLRGQFLFPQPLSAAPVADPLRQTLLVPGESFLLYTLDLEDFVCQSVHTLDHEAGAIRCQPILLDRFLLVIGANGLQRSSLRCFFVSEEDGSLAQRQEIDLNGWVWHKPAVRGGRLFVTTESGHVSVIDVGRIEDAKPLSVVAASREVLENSAFQALPLVVAQDRFYTAGESLAYYRLQPEDTVPRPRWEAPMPGPAVVDPGVESIRVIAAARDQNSGAVVAFGFDMRAHELLWKCELGVLPDLIGQDSAQGDVLLIETGAISTRLTLDDLAKDGIIEQPAASRQRKNSNAQMIRDLHELRDWTDGVLRWGGVGSDRLVLHAPGGKTKEIRLPQNIANTPVTMGKGVLIPTVDGLLHWVDPRTGEDLCEPYAEQFLSSGPVTVGPIAVVSDKSAIVVVGDNVIRLLLVDEPFAYLQETARMELRASSGNHLVHLSDRILLVDGDRLLSLQAENLQQLSPWPLGTPVSRPPVVSGGDVFFLTDADKLLCFGGTGAEADVRWETQLQSSPLRVPVPTDDTVWLAFGDGSIVGLRTEDGAVARQVDVGRQIIDGPWLMGDAAVVMAPDGSLSAIKLAADDALRVQEGKN